MSAKPTYVFVINSLGAGGAERSLADILPHVRERGVHPLVVCFKAPDVGFEREVREAGTEVVVLRSNGLLGHMRRLRRILKKRQPALVYTALFDAHLVGRMASIGTGIPVLSNITNVNYDPARFRDPNVNARKLRILQMIDGWTSRHLTDHFHAVSGAVKDSAVDSLRVSADDVTVVHRGRGRERLGLPSDERRAKVRADLGIEPAAPVLITVGRQEYQKGQRYLLEAVPTIAAKWPDLVVLVVGREGHVTGLLRTLTSELGIGGSVRFLGHRTDVGDLLNAADLFIFPSVYEGLGGSNLEAMAMGLPLVVSDIPALREVVTEGENGTLVPAEDPNALAAAVDGLLADPSLRARYGRRSIEMYEERFQSVVSIPRSVDLMQRVARHN